MLLVVVVVVFSSPIQLNIDDEISNLRQTHSIYHISLSTTIVHADDVDGQHRLK